MQENRQSNICLCRLRMWIIVCSYSVRIVRFGHLESSSNKPMNIAMFRGRNIRKVLYKGEWWFSVVDVIAALTDQIDGQTARKYWNRLSQRLREEGSQSVTNCHRLKLEAVG